ncbi:hypothetical protein, partial [Robinsoniella peoriensis]
PVFSGGSKVTIRFHSSSVNSYRLNILNTPFSLFYHKMGMQNICFVQLLIFKHALGRNQTGIDISDTWCIYALPPIQMINVGQM